MRQGRVKRRGATSRRRQESDNVDQTGTKQAPNKDDAPRATILHLCFPHGRSLSRACSLLRACFAPLASRSPSAPFISRTRLVCYNYQVSPPLSSPVASCQAPRVPVLEAQYTCAALCQAVLVM
jgi:hypothetical protein